MYRSIFKLEKRKGISDEEEGALDEKVYNLAIRDAVVHIYNKNEVAKKEVSLSIWHIMPKKKKSYIVRIGEKWIC